MPLRLDVQWGLLLVVCGNVPTSSLELGPVLVESYLNVGSVCLLREGAVGGSSLVVPSPFVVWVLDFQHHH